MADENSGNWLAIFIVKFINFDVIDSDDSRFLQISEQLFQRNWTVSLGNWTAHREN